LREYTKRLQRDTKNVKEWKSKSMEKSGKVKVWKRVEKSGKEWKSIWTMPLNPVAAFKRFCRP